MANGIAVFGSQLQITVNTNIKPLSPGYSLLTYNTPQQILQTDADGYHGNFQGASFFGVADQTELAAFSPSGFSGTFNGASDYLTLASNANFAFGAGNWTIEFWIYPTTTPGAGGQQIFDTRPASTQGVYPTIYFASDRTIRFYTSTADRITSSALTLNTWNHIAVTKNGSTTTMYLNGTATGSTYADTNTYIQAGIRIGASFTGGATIINYFAGNLSNLRVVRGVAVYTGTFTSPATPLSNTQTASTNIAAISTNTSTVILTLNTGTGFGLVSTQFTDRSSYNNTLTVAGGNPTMTPTYGISIGYPPAPIDLTMAIGGSSSVPGWAIQFNGSTGYIGVADNANIRFNAGDFTLEGWIYITNYTYANVLFSKGGSGNDWALATYPSTGKLYFALDATDYLYTTTPQVPLNTWTHIAAVRSGNTITLYLNGANVGTITFTGSFTSTGELRLGRGRNSSSNYFNGYISNARATKSALYTANFTPVAPLTVSTSSVILLTGQSSSIVDNSTNAYTINLYGSPTPSALGVFYTNGSISLTQQNTQPAPVVSFNGTSQFISTPVNAGAFTLASSTRPFTLELWVNPTAFTGITLISSSYPGAGIIPFVIGMSNGTDANGTSLGAFPWFNYYTGSVWAAGAISNTPLTLNTWQHVAVVFTGADAYIYINGTRTATWSGTTWIAGAATAQLLIGRRWDTGGSTFFTGFISNVRFTNGTALYLNDFTPAAPLTASTGVTSLLALTTATIGDASTNTFVLTVTGTPAPSISTSTYVYANNRISLPQGLAWTAECWINPSNRYTNYNTIFSKRGNLGTSYQGFLNIGDGRLGFFNGTIILSRFTPPPDKWTHCAWVFDINNNLYIYVDGRNVLTTATSVVEVVSPFTVGATYGSTNQPQEYFNGKISNLRVVKGTAVYTGDFTVPSFPLGLTQSASTNTVSISTSDVSLLTLQDSTLIDKSIHTTTFYSSVAPAIIAKGPGFYNTTTLFTDGTRNGFYEPTVVINPDWSTNFNTRNTELTIKVNTAPAGTGLLYGKNSTPVTSNTPISLVTVPISGYSANFNVVTTNSYLTVNSSTSLVLTNSDWTLETWANPIGDYTNFNCIISKRINGSSSTSYSMYLAQTTGNLMFYNGYAVYSSNTPIPNGQWSHLAIVYTSATNTATNLVNMYINGVRVHSTVVQPTVDYATPVTIGWSNFGLENFRGKLSNLRMSSKAVYTGNFTVPASPLLNTQSSSTNTAALLSSDVDLLTLQDSTFIDRSIYNNSISPSGVNFVQLVPEGPGYYFTTATNVSNTFTNFYNPITYYSVGLNTRATATATDYITISGSETLLANLNNWSSSTYYSVEYWINPNTLLQTVDANTSTAVVGQMQFNSTVTSWTFGPVGNGTVKFTYNTGTTSTIATTATIGPGRWNHLAFVKNVNTLTIYINGEPRATAPLVGTPISSLGAFTIGARNSTYFNGRLSDLRVISGELAYTGTFTVNYTPLTAITGTQLLTFQDPTFIDESTNTFTLNTVGNPVILRGGPYLNYTGTVNTSTINLRQLWVPNSIYTNNTDPFGTVANGFTAPTSIPPGYSINFSGNEMIRTSESTGTRALDLLGDFTIEGWFRRDSGTAGSYILNRAGGLNIAWASYQIVASNGSVWFSASSNNAGSYDIGSEGSTGTIGFYNLGQWTNFHITRNGNVYSGYVNGVGGFQQVTTATPYSPSSLLGVDRGLAIGGTFITQWNGSTASNYLPGAVSNIRISRTASPYSLFTGTHYTNYSNYFNGSNDYFQVNTNTNTALGFGGGGTTWTVECYLRPSGNYSATRTIWSSRVSGAATTMAQGYLNATTGAVSFYNGTTFISSYTLLPDVWSHVAWVYDGATIRIFVNGLLIYTNQATVTNQGQPFTVGGGRGLAEFFQGYMSNLRVTRGVQVYTTSSALVLDGDVTQGYGALFKDGSADQINIASTTTFGLGTSTFTIEALVYPTSNPSNGPGTLFEFRTSANNTAMNGRINSNLNLMFFDGPQVIETAFTGARVNVREWNHIAWVRNINTMTAYINGISAGSVNLSPTVSTYGTSQPLRIAANQTAGYSFAGIISNFKITRGVARYTTSTYVIPTAPLSADANTIYLALQSSTFTATFSNTYSGVNVAMTLGGNPGISSNVGYTTTGSIVTVPYFNNPAIPLSNIQSSSTNTNSISGTQTSLLVMQNPGPGITDNSTYAFTSTILSGHVYAALYPNPTTWTNFIPSPITLTTTTNTVLLIASTPIGTQTKTVPSWAGRISASSYLTLSNNNRRYQIPGNFTIEAWVRPLIASNHSIVSYWTNAAPGSSSFRMGISAGRGLLLDYAQGATAFTLSTSTQIVPINTWTHVAIVRTGSTVNYYVNGVQDATVGTITGALNASTSPLYVGIQDPTTSNSFRGDISNLRIVNGVAVYTGNFTPPSNRLTASQAADTNISAITTQTVLLTLQDSAFVDNSTAATLPLTVVGIPFMTRSAEIIADTDIHIYQDISTSSLYLSNTSTSVVIPVINSVSPFGSVVSSSTWYSNYFNGTSDLYTITAQTATTFASTNFTIEAWVHPISITSYACILDARSAAASTSWVFGLRSINGAYRVELFNGATNNGNTIVPLYQWTHIAITRSSNVLSYWVNGQLDTTSTIATTANAQAITQRLGYLYDGGSNGFNGFISNLRVVRGIAAYTSTFTPARTLSITQDAGTGTQAIPAITAASTYTGTTLLLFQDQYNKDNGPQNVRVLLAGGSPIVTTNSPYGWTSATYTSTSFQSIFRKTVSISSTVTGFTYITTSTSKFQRLYIPVVYDQLVPDIFTQGSGTYTTNFNGASYLLIANTATLAMSSSSWTMEAWINPSINQTFSVNQGLFGKRIANIVTGSSYMSYLSAATGVLSFSNFNTTYTTNYRPPAGQWTHVAYAFSVSTSTSNTGTINIYANGKNIYSTATTIVNNTGTFVIGYNNTSTEFFVGQMSNLRVTKGKAVYTGDFNVPPYPLLTVQSTSTNTQALLDDDVVLLTLQSSTFINNSTTPLTLFTSIAPIITWGGPSYVSTSSYKTDIMSNGEVRVPISINQQVFDPTIERHSTVLYNPVTITINPSVHAYPTTGLWRYLPYTKVSTIAIVPFVPSGQEVGPGGLSDYWS